MAPYKEDCIVNILEIFTVPIFKAKWLFLPVGDTKDLQNISNTARFYTVA
jgi:hypothetical protein